MKGKTAADAVRENAESLVKANVIYGGLRNHLLSPEGRAVFKRMGGTDEHLDDILHDLRGAMVSLVHVFNMAGISDEEGIEIAQRVEREERIIRRLEVIHRIEEDK